MIFRFPRPLTVVRIYNLITDGRADKALRILSKFYRIPPPKIEVNPDAIYRSHPQDFLNILAIYNPRAQTIYCKTQDVYRWPMDVLHEFFHHLGHCLGVRHNNETPDDFARLFLQSMGDAELLLHDEQYILGLYRVFAALSIMPLSRREIGELLSPKYRWYPSIYSGKYTHYNRKTRKWELLPRGRHVMHLIAKYYRGTEVGKQLEKIWNEVVGLTERSVRIEELEKLR
jgi:hypothetical protein